jgi:hypothetical protein
VPCLSHPPTAVSPFDSADYAPESPLIERVAAPATAGQTLALRPGRQRRHPSRLASVQIKGRRVVTVPGPSTATWNGGHVRVRRHRRMPARPGRQHPVIQHEVDTGRGVSTASRSSSSRGSNRRFVVPSASDAGNAAGHRPDHPPAAVPRRAAAAKRSGTDVRRSRWPTRATDPGVQIEPAMPHGAEAARSRARTDQPRCDRSRAHAAGAASPRA